MEIIIIIWRRQWRMPRDRRKYLKPSLYVAVSADRARSRHIKIRFKVKLLRLMRNICDPLSLNCTRGFSSWLRINGPDLPPPHLIPVPLQVVWQRALHTSENGKAVMNGSSHEVQYLLPHAVCSHREVTKTLRIQSGQRSRRPAHRQPSV